MEFPVEELSQLEVLMDKLGTVPCQDNSRNADEHLVTRDGIARREETEPMNKKSLPGKLASLKAHWYYHLSHSVRKD